METEYDGSAQHCISVDWPAAYTWSARQYRRGYDGPISWMGSLIYESRDASGLYYRRNRYYDSEKARFTQEDPIGLAGGVNVYGFANGDPVTYVDPYGLSACPLWMVPGSAACILWDAYQAHGTSGVADEIIGNAPFTSTAQDIKVAVTGRTFTGNSQSRISALVGLATPLAGSQIHAALEGSKSTVRAAISTLDVAEDVARAASVLIRDAGRGERWGVEAAEEGGVIIHRYVAGGDRSSSAIYTYVLDAKGRVVGTLQRAFDAAGDLTHFDVKK